MRCCAESAQVLGITGRKGLQYFFGFLPVAFKGHQHRDFVPDIVKALIVACRRFGKYLTVGNMNDPAGALVGLYPVADLHEGELEDALVDNIARSRADLDPVAHFKWIAPQDKRPSCKVDHRVPKGDSDTGREQAQKCRQGS